MTRRLALLGGSFNPPALHHRAIAARLAEEFDEVVVVPCGPRPDKPATNEVPPTYRAAMADMAFGDIAKVRVELFDLEAGRFTPAIELDRRYRGEGEVWHVIGPDLVRGGKNGQSRIQTEWHDGREYWKSARFVVYAGRNRNIDEADLPPQSRVLRVDEDGVDLAIRSRVFHRDKVDGLLAPRVAGFIDRHGLYRGAPASRFASFKLTGPRLDLVVDERNPQAVEIGRTLEPFISDDPELIAVVGGDGTMLRAIRQHWRRRVPFYGVNTGHLGFLLNRELPLDCVAKELVLCYAPLLYCEVEKLNGERANAVAFNDAWVERATGQTAWIEVRVDGQVRIPQLVADGALVATAAGSTSYARAMGATPVPLNTPALVLVGSNVLRPAFWRPVVLPADAQVELQTLDPAKRPLHGYIDGVSQGEVKRLAARASNIAAVELVFAPGHDPAAKLASIQFPMREE